MRLGDADQYLIQLVGLGPNRLGQQAGGSGSIALLEKRHIFVTGLLEAFAELSQLLGRDDSP